MNAPETRRHELYTGLSNVLGPELTDNLMGYLPTSPGIEVATRSDIADVRAVITELRSETKEEFTSLRAEVKEQFTAVRGEIAGLRSDMTKLYLTLIGGFLAVVATVIGAGIWS